MATTTSPTTTSINTALTTTAITMVTSCDGMLAVVLGGGVLVEVGVSEGLGTAGVLVQMRVILERGEIEEGSPVLLAGPN